MDADLKKFEEELQRFAPRHLPDDLIARMEAAMEGWEEEDCKLVPFPPREEIEPVVRRSSGMWAAAAGVAILGVAIALLVSQPAQRAESISASPGQGMASASVTPVVFGAEAAKRTYLDASDEGVVITDRSRPVRLLRLEYIDKVEFKSGSGEELHVERPVVNYFLVPVRTD